MLTEFVNAGGGGGGEGVGVGVWTINDWPYRTYSRQRAVVLLSSEPRAASVNVYNYAKEK